MHKSVAKARGKRAIFIARAEGPVAKRRDVPVAEYGTLPAKAMPIVSLRQAATSRAMLVAAVENRRQAPRAM
eukprot:516809-Pleurochrysis_carterae.AAC.1